MSVDRRLGVYGAAAFKVPCAAYTTSNISLYGEQTHVGVSVVDGDRVLVRAQTNKVENGIYVVGRQTWRRAADFNGPQDVVHGTMVLAWSSNGSSIFRVTTADPVIIDQSQIVFDVLSVALLDRLVNVRQFGAVGDGVTDDTAAFLGAVKFVKDTYGSGPVLVPAGDYPLVGAEIVIDFNGGGLNVQPGARIKQMTYGLSVVQIVEAEGVRIYGGGTLYNPITKTEITGTYNGNPARTRAAGVYMYGAQNCTVEDLKIDSTVCGVIFFPTTAQLLTTRMRDNKIRDMRFQHYDFGMLGNNQEGLQISGCSGYFADRSQGNVAGDDNGPAPHLLYLSGKAGTNLKNQNVSVIGCTDFFNQHSSSFKAKYTDGLEMMSCLSNLCARGFDLDVQNAKIGVPMVRNILGLGQVALNFNATCSGVEVLTPLVYVNTDLSEYAEWVSGLPTNFDSINTMVTEETCSNITVRGGVFDTNHQAASAPPAKIAGTNINLIGVKFIERGVDTYPVQFKNATTCRLIRPEVQSAGTKVVDITATAVGSVIEIDPAVLSFTFGSTSYSNAGTNTQIALVGGEISSVWTPVPTFDTPGDFAPTNVTAKGWSRRQNGWITVGFLVEFDANAYTTAAGEFRVDGLEFAAVSATAGGTTYSAGLGRFGKISGTIAGLSILLSSSDNFLKFWRSQSASAGGKLDTTNIPAGTTAVKLYGEITYKIA